ncbi:MAG: class I SAM-dependent methyltransferase [Sphingobacteriales bacterium]|nr:class I SAM-dependent methyltransferase [Sphingobacteriales bacterium]MBI3717545.1 class I SAM-dependent methyltransferase [Sphingobacteriales bacterium]
MKKNAKYIPALRFNWLTRFYDFLISKFLGEKKWKELIIASVVNHRPEKKLDVGCGTATLTIMLQKEFLAASVTGIDGDSKILAIADKKIKEAELNINLKETLSFNLPFADDHFDVVVSSLMLHHLSDEDKQKTLHEIIRVLRPGCHFVVADWGKPNSIFIRWLFYIVQLLDGFAITKSNLKGLLPSMIIDAGFVAVKELQRIPTMLGSISIISSKKP